MDAPASNAADRPTREDTGRFRPPLRVLIVGAGGRDHALAWSVSHSSRLGELHVAPGNAGIEHIATCHPHIDEADHDSVVRLAIEIGADLVIVGAEDRLVGGLGSDLASAGIACFGPSADAAQLEGSKRFAKSLMDQVGIPTARWWSLSDPDQARALASSLDGHVAIKADGLALGCGAVVCHSIDEAHDAIHALMEQRVFGDAGSSVIIEELISGHEVSVMAITDGTTIVPLPPACDYKRLADDDEGPNTGGMGAHAPSHDLSQLEGEQLAYDVIQPIVDELARRGTPFRGVIYAGVMLTADGPKVLEYNGRFGNPETQALVRLLDIDLLDLMDRAARGALAGAAPARAAGAAVAVCVAAPGYPEVQMLPRPTTITGLDAARAVDGVELFMGMTASVTGTTDSLDGAGGRVVTVSAHAATMGEAMERAYEAVDHIELAGAQVRRDIGRRAASILV